MTVTPMMAQYLEIKAAHPGSLLFYRMGDFYEMFFDDAVAAAEALDIALTKRGKHDGVDIPMCGVPVHAAEGYFLTLIRKGFRVAVCEQMESPAEAKKRGSKSVVKREVVRLVTPGTLSEDSLLNARKHNFLAAYATIRDEAALAWIDMSTGVFRIEAINPVKLGPELARLAPSELIILDDDFAEVTELVSDFSLSLTPLSRASFDSTAGEARLCDLFKVQTLDAFGSFSRAQISAMGAIVDYLSITQKGNLPRIRPPQQEDQSRRVQIDAATRRNLELTSALSGGRTGSLLATMDRTLTAGGARLLERRLSNPSRDPSEINNRLDALGFFLEAPQTDQVRDALRRVPDLDRALSRLSLGRGGPRDVAAIRDGLGQAAQIAAIPLTEGKSIDIETAISDLGGHDTLIAQLEDAVVAEPPVFLRDGGFIAPGFDADLDDARTLRDEGRAVIAAMQQDFITHTGITSLKIKHNNVLGYFIEITATHAEKMLSAPLSETYIHRQTTANQVRFTTVELSELETRILNAGNRALEIEKALFESLVDAVLSSADRIFETANALAALDVAAALAQLAQSENWCKPKVDDSRAFAITQGRHPVVERALRDQTGDPFIANDCDLSADAATPIWLLTGPNMAGKSTFLRQNALIAIIAQMGSYVPAAEAHIGAVSQIFSRVGASDDLARGRSTFMVEMVETAAILNQADDRALVILDEIGRGTATYDGLSIAWATLEHLHDVNKSRALFATHYHELTALGGKLAGVDNATVSVREFEGEIVFLHEVKKGAADRSYGVQVAQLAGLPTAVIARARTVLEALEKGEREGGASQKALIDDLPLFSQAPPPLSKPQSTPALDMIAEIHPDELTPKQALELIYQIKEAAKD